MGGLVLARLVLWRAMLALIHDPKKIGRAMLALVQRGELRGVQHAVAGRVAPQRLHGERTRGQHGVAETLPCADVADLTVGCVVPASDRLRIGLGFRQLVRSEEHTSELQSPS